MKIEVKEIKTIEPPKEYVLTLDQNELDLIVVCLGSIGGYDGPEGWRKVLNNMYNALYKNSKIKQGILEAHTPLIPSDRYRVVPEV